MHNLLKITIKEGIGNVYLLDVPTLSDNKSKDDAESDNRTKSFEKVHTKGLLKPLSH